MILIGRLTSDPELRFLPGNGNAVARFSASGFDRVYKILQTIDGGYIFSSMTTSNDGDVSGNHQLERDGEFYNSTDIWLVKLDSDGNIEWQQCYGGSAYDFPNNIKQTTDEGYVLVGSTYSNDGDVSGNHGSMDSLVLKLDAYGNVEWQKCIGGYAWNDGATDVIETRDGVIWLQVLLITRSIFIHPVYM